MIFDHYSLPFRRDTYASFPSVAVNGDCLYVVYREAGLATVEAALRGAPTHHDNDSRIMFTSSSDQGLHWEDPRCIHSGSFGINDPGLSITSRGIFLLRFTEIQVVPAIYRNKLTGPLLAHREDLRNVSCVSGNFILSSTDLGVTWTTPKLMDLGEHRYSVSRESIIELPDESLLLSIYESRPHSTERSYVVRSFDGGTTWSDSTCIASDKNGAASCYQGKNFNETALLRTAANRLLAVIRTDESYYANDGSDFMTIGGIGSLHTAHSDNNGLSWTTPNSTLIFGQPASLCKMPDDTICMVYGRRKHPYGIAGRWSHDGGHKWSEEWTVRQDAPHWDIGYPAVATTSSHLVVVYYWQDSNGYRTIEASTVQLSEL